MCRLLYIRSKQPIEIGGPLKQFARIARDSKEYQGHGWGCAYLNNNRWEIYKNLKPVWEDEALPGVQSTLLVAHARSAFRDREIIIENNMPFIRNDEVIFIFNGELHGVKLKESGGIGAEKIFNFIMRFYQGNLLAAMQKGLSIVERRSRYIKAMNIIMADRQKACLSTLFNTNESYFTMHVKREPGSVIICSDPFPGETGWQPLPNNTMGMF